MENHSERKEAMSTFQIPVSRLQENDGILIHGVPHRVIRVYESIYKGGIEVTCMSDYEAGILRISFEKDDLIEVIAMATK